MSFLPHYKSHNRRTYLGFYLKSIPVSQSGALFPSPLRLPLTFNAMLTESTRPPRERSVVVCIARLAAFASAPLSSVSLSPCATAVPCLRLPQAFWPRSLLSLPAPLHAAPRRASRESNNNREARSKRRLDAETSSPPPPFCVNCDALPVAPVGPSFAESVQVTVRRRRRVNGPPRH